MVHASIPSPSISYFDLGPLRVHFYALCILTGIVIAVWLSSARLTARGGKPGMVMDIAMWTVPIGIVGGRLYLAAYALRFGATGLTFLDDEVTEFFSPHAEGKSVMFLTALGRTARGSPAPRSAQTV